MKIHTISFLFILILTGQWIDGQTIVKGKVLSNTGELLVGVNISIVGTYNGTITDTNGEFELEVENVTGKELNASFIGYKTQTINLSDNTDPLLIKLNESVTGLNAVTITAGSFAADDKERASVLEPLDIYTTAGSLGDINGALKTLPGTQSSSDDGRLLVRGGAASETSVYVDGLLAAKPYYSKVPDLPTRGRFSPSLFSGTVFSTGGYSAEYGQALSSVLVLESNDIEVEELTGVSLMSVGADLSKTWCAPNRSTSLGLGYMNLAPYYNLVNNRLDWTKPSESEQMNFIHRKKFNNGGLLKIFSTAEYGERAFNTEWDAEQVKISNNNTNAYLNVNYSLPIGEKSMLKSGVATTLNNDRQLAWIHRTRENEVNIEGRLTFVSQLSDGIKLKTGFSDAFTNYEHHYNQLQSEINWEGKYDDHILGFFAEPEIKLNSRFAIRPGLRFEYSTYLNKQNLSPRFAAAYRTGKNTQLSVAYGQYFQSPVADYLKFGSDFNNEKATHYIMSLQTGSLKERLLRLEAYYKDYDHLVTYSKGTHPYNNSFSSNGFGYAKGIDLFYRDRKTFSGTDYWVSYSYIDTKRLFLDYPVEATPDFIANHTISAVAKYFIGAIHTQVGAAWTTASGRPYHQPGDADFMTRKADIYNNLNLNLSYLTHIANHYTIIHFSISNVLGSEQLVGYQTIKNYDGKPDSLVPLLPDVKQFLFLGIFISIK
ncbi:TonB-dependent receptor domain-containing protein [Carboxylicivirga caseinilyticus]|uniref:TonB-dependent receptor plug domain-containing protein n=1 Tax=Carboxylicivirga caseinilyticus TaxID=3417572 RepID=UPI003D3501F3|nr:TonB-dependent receptor [Marinilabiliaceae bacterium A049]